MSRDSITRINPENLETTEKLTGFPPETATHITQSGREYRPLFAAWISDELLDETRRVWSKAYGRSVGVEEAVEILTNVKHLATTLLKAKKGGSGK